MASVTGFTAERMLEIENSTVVDGEVIGDDLILLRRDGTTINAGDVKGPAGSLLAVVELSTAVDMNTLLTTAYYTQSQNADAASGTNYPVPLAGLLEVVNNTAENMVWQRYTVYNSNNTYAGTVWTRTRYLEAWSPWAVTGGVTPYLCRHKTAPTNPPNTAELTIDYDGADHMEGGMLYSNGVATVPRTGKYTINAMFHMQSNATNGFAMCIRHNGSKWRQLNFKHDGTNVSYEISSTLRADAGDTFDIRVNVPVVGSIIYGVAPGIRYTSLDIVWAGQ